MSAKIFVQKPEIQDSMIRLRLDLRSKKHIGLPVKKSYLYSELMAHQGLADHVTPTGANIEFMLNGHDGSNVSSATSCQGILWFTPIQTREEQLSQGNAATTLAFVNFSFEIGPSPAVFCQVFYRSGLGQTFLLTGTKLKAGCMLEENPHTEHQIETILRFFDITPFELWGRANTSPPPPQPVPSDPSPAPPPPADASNPIAEPPNRPLGQDPLGSFGANVAGLPSAEGWYKTPAGYCRKWEPWEKAIVQTAMKQKQKQNEALAEKYGCAPPRRVCKWVVT